MPPAAGPSAPSDRLLLVGGCSNTLLPWQEMLAVIDLSSGTWCYVTLPVSHGRLQYRHTGCGLVLGLLRGWLSQCVLAATFRSSSPAGGLACQEVPPRGSLLVNHTAFLTPSALVVTCGGGNCFSFGTHFDPVVTAFSLPESCRGGSEATSACPLVASSVPAATTLQPAPPLGTPGEITRASRYCLDFLVAIRPRLAPHTFPRPSTLPAALHRWLGTPCRFCLTVAGGLQVCRPKKSMQPDGPACTPQRSPLCSPVRLQPCSHATMQPCSRAAGNRREHVCTPWRRMRAAHRR